MAILETRGLRKVYGSGDTEVRALDGVVSARFPKYALCWRRMPKPLSTAIPLRRTSTKLFFAIPVSGLSATIALRTSYTGWAFLLFPA